VVILRIRCCRRVWWGEASRTRQAFARFLHKANSDHQYCHRSPKGRAPSGPIVMLPSITCPLIYLAYYFLPSDHDLPIYMFSNPQYMSSYISLGQPFYQLTHHLRILHLSYPMPQFLRIQKIFTRVLAEIKKNRRRIDESFLEKSVFDLRSVPGSVFIECFHLIILCLELGEHERESC
jgi:hypothetical protein